MALTPKGVGYPSTPPPKTISTCYPLFIFVGLGEE